VTELHRLPFSAQWPLTFGIAYRTDLENVNAFSCAGRIVIGAMFGLDLFMTAVIYRICVEFIILAMRLH
jgi:hypothetical protein